MLLCCVFVNEDDQLPQPPETRQGSKKADSHSVAMGQLVTDNQQSGFFPASTHLRKGSKSTPPPPFLIRLSKGCLTALNISSILENTYQLGFF